MHIFVLTWNSFHGKSCERLLPEDINIRADIIFITIQEDIIGSDNVIKNIIGSTDLSDFTCYSHTSGFMPHFFVKTYLFVKNHTTEGKHVTHANRSTSVIFSPSKSANIHLLVVADEQTHTHDAVAFVGCHLSHSSKTAREKAFQTIVDTLQKLSPYAIICGDFNFYGTDSQPLLEKYPYITESQITFPHTYKRTPGTVQTTGIQKYTDRIFIYNKSGIRALQIYEYGSFASQKTINSDHNAVFANIDMRLTNTGYLTIDDILRPIDDINDISSSNFAIVVVIAIIIIIGLMTYVKKMKKYATTSIEYPIQRR